MVRNCYIVTVGPIALSGYLRPGSRRLDGPGCGGLFDGREVASLLSGEPEYLEPLGAELDLGVIVSEMITFNGGPVRCLA